MSNYFSFTSVLLLLRWVLFPLFLVSTVQSYVTSLLPFYTPFALLPCFLPFFLVTVVLELKYSSRPIVPELRVVFFLQGEGVTLGDESPPVKSCLDNSPFGDEEFGLIY